jgi:hypothetical protein
MSTHLKDMDTQRKKKKGANAEHNTGKLFLKDYKMDASIAQFELNCNLVCERT